jgi:SAM-dependent methyltransferase
LQDVFADLGMSPVSNAFVKPDDLNRAEVFFPLKALVCRACFLVQTLDVVGREGHFHDDYVYFSSMSSDWLVHAREFCSMAIAREKLGPQSFVVEVASNDGYLLQNFVREGIPCLGIDPAANCAEAALKTYGVKTHVGFFGVETAKNIVTSHRHADLTAANNVLAHVPDLKDFIGGFKVLLAPGGLASFEFPHLLRLIERNQFDTIYHEHYSYLSLVALAPLFARQGLKMVDVQELSTHGGSLRLFVRHADHADQPSAALQDVLARERAAGLETLAAYEGFRSQVHETKRRLVSLLIGLKNDGRRIAAYGAPAKGNTLLNYCGVGPDFIDYTVDRSASKQGRYLPGTRIPVYAPEHLIADRPDYVLILPWNIRDEIITQLADVSTWGGRFIVPIPTPEIV